MVDTVLLPIWFLFNLLNVFSWGDALCITFATLPSSIFQYFATSLFAETWTKMIIIRFWVGPTNIDQPTLSKHKFKFLINAFDSTAKWSIPSASSTLLGPLHSITMGCQCRQTQATNLLFTRFSMSVKCHLLLVTIPLFTRPCATW